MRARPDGARRAATLVMLVVAVALFSASIATAATPSRKKAMWGPTQVNGQSQFPIYRDLGVGIYQHSLSWRDVAVTRPAHPRDPNDPAYHWPDDVNFAVSEASHYRMRVMLTIVFTPVWARHEGAPNLPPDRLADFADFAEAAARRYPSVLLWMVWGEPNRIPNYYLDKETPQQAQGKDPFTPRQRAQVSDYAVLLDQTYGRLKRLNRRNLIIGGNTFTGGDISAGSWIKHLKLPNGKPPRMDLYGHNPFSTRMPDLAKNELAAGTADFSDLDLLAKWLDRYLARDGRNRHLPIFISEFTAPTDVESYEFNFHVTRAVQAKWLRAGLRIARRWSRIYTFGWIGLRDLPPDSMGRESRTGLIDVAGVRKPAYYAYKRG
ncbi:MAG: hypothetical protein M3P44_16845 [Actinomycetota bacterium]|nr:hypothetical protein [Actinomycetota bacterium]